MEISLYYKSHLAGDLINPIILLSYSLMKGFEAQASNAVLDFTGDDDSQMRKKKNMMRWDVKKKKYVKAEQVC